MEALPYSQNTEQGGEYRGDLPYTELGRVHIDVEVVISR